MDGDFARFGAEHEALDAHEVAYVEEFLEDVVVEALVLAGADVVAAHVDLYAAFAVLELHEGGFAHDASAHDAAGNGHGARLGIVAEILLYLGRASRHGKLFGGIRLYAAVAQRLHGTAAHHFLFAQLALRRLTLVVIFAGHAAL